VLIAPIVHNSLKFPVDILKTASDFLSLNMRSFLILILFISIKGFAQNHIKESEAISNIGKKVEILGHVYRYKLINKDYAILKVGYNLKKANLLTYWKFKNASMLADLTYGEFGHLIGIIRLIDGNPILIVDKPHNANFYVPKDERVDSANYYLKRGQL
jgi:hypothetical protein